MIIFVKKFHFMTDYLKNTSKRNRQNLSRRRRKYGRPIWPFVVIVLVLGTALIAVSAYKYSNKGGKSKSNPVAASSHYADLEIAEGGDGGNVVKRYEGFTVCFNHRNMTPDWVGWELLRSEVNGGESRSDKFWKDWELDGCASPDDYRNSGYDKGHLCPAADQKWSAAAMSDCFVMANMAPQEHALNAGAWKTLEEKERLWAERDSAIVIVAGPIYAKNDRKKIGSGVRVPSAFFKVLLAPYIEEPRAIGFVYPNMRAPGNMADYSMSVDKVEELTGLDFFSNLPDDLENRLESHASFNDWNRR